MSFFSSTSGAVDAGTTTQPMRIFTGSVCARARVAVSATPNDMAPVVTASHDAAPHDTAVLPNWRRLMPRVIAFPPVFAPLFTPDPHRGLLIAVKACYPPPPTQS